MAIKQVFYRSPHNYDLEAASDESAARPVGDSLTVQSMAEDADINVLMRRYGITGKMPENPRVPQYGDFTHVTDFASALDAVMQAEDMFMELPAEVRAKFNNSPQDLLLFASDPGNKDAMRAIFGGKDVSVGSGSGGAPPAPAGAGGAPGAAAGGNPPAAGGSGVAAVGGASAGSPPG